MRTAAESNPESVIRTIRRHCNLTMESVLSSSLLHDLPDSISVMIFKDWLYPSDIGHLDATFCNVAEREWWLTMLAICSKDVFQISKMENVDNFVRDPLRDWILNRNVLVKHVALPIHNSLIDEQSEKIDESSNRQVCHFYRSIFLYHNQATP